MTAPKKSPKKLPRFIKCPTCDDVVPAEHASTRILLDDKEVAICDSCAWHYAEQTINE